MLRPAADRTDRPRERPPRTRRVRHVPRPLRICLIGHHVAPIAPPFAGGVESFTSYLARWLARRGHEVVLHAAPGSAVDGVEVRPLDLRPRRSGAARADVSMPPAAFMDAHHAYQRLMVDLVRGGERFDLVHSHTLHYLPVAMASLLGTPLLLTLHTPPTPWLESALRAAGADAPHLNAVSAQTARAWSAVAAVDDVVPNGVDAGAWPEGTGGADAVWCGRIVPEKAPHLAIDAARRAGLAVRLAGPVVDRGYWEREVVPRLGPDARYVGHLDHEALAAFLGSGRVALVTPEWDEPFGLVAAEAMTCGTPVAGIDRGGLADVVGDLGGRLAPPGDLAALAAAARAAARMDRAVVRAFARERHDIDVMGRRYEALYARVLGRRPALARSA